MGALGKIVAVLMVLVLAAAAGLGWEGHRRFTSAGPLAEPATIIIPKGARTEAIARLLHDAGVVSSPLVFAIGTKLRKATLKAGEYEFPAHVSGEEAMRILAEGRVVKHKLTIAEGLTVRQVMALVTEADFLAGSITRHPAEGHLLPETWFMVRDETRDEAIARMEKAMSQTLDTLWVARDPSVRLKTKEEALILASMVERETPIPAERPRVAAVFYNRLAKGMRLQSDPTVIYGASQGLGELDHPLTRAELQTTSAWNTYTIDGLPRTPIANPGRASLEAVLHPAKTDALYFVADGSGGHAFAKTLDEHNANVVKWRKLEKAVQ